MAKKKGQRQRQRRSRRRPRAGRRGRRNALTVSTSDEVDDCLTWAGASRGAVSEPRLHSTTPARSTNEGVG